MLKTITLFYICTLHFAMPLYAQKLSYAQSKADLVQLKNSIQKYNPALQVYNTSFESNCDEFLSSFEADSISLIDHFKRISQVCAMSNEGHFALGNWNDTVHSGFLNNRYKYLPVSVKILQEKLFVWTDNSTEQLLKRGDEILAINDLKVPYIFSLIDKSLPSDGQIKTYNLISMELGFAWMFYLYVAQPTSFRLEIKDTDDRLRYVTVQSLNRATQFENNAKYTTNQNKNESDEMNEFYHLKHTGDVSYLSLPSFDFLRIKKYGIKSKKMYASIFRELGKRLTRYLVVDLRNNTGGRNEFADDIVPFINKGLNRGEFLKKSVSWQGKEKTYKIPKTSKFFFQGSIYVLVNGKTFSSGSVLARYLKEYANATIIGEESGTRYEGFAAGSKQYITLSNSKLRIGIPRYHIFFPKSNIQHTSNQGLLPDYKIEYTLEDIEQGSDLHLEKVKSLIQAEESAIIKKQ